jgi:hypothetical protein
MDTSAKIWNTSAAAPTVEKTVLLEIWALRV